ncbi:hypothetical protein LCGC14_2443410, partial [marine sediment metagenome]
MVTRFVPTARQRRQEERQRRREAEVAASRERIRRITAGEPPIVPEPELEPVTLIPEPELELPEIGAPIPEPQFRRRFEPEVERLISTLHPKLFPEIPEEELARFTPDIGAIIDWAQRNPDDFMERVWRIGRTPETEAVFIRMGATEAHLDELFPPEVEAELAAPQAVLEPEPEWQNASTGEVITQSEKDRRFPLGHEIELDEWRLTAETGRNYFIAFKVFGEALTKLPKQIGASILQAIQGHEGASVVDKGWADRFIESANTDLEKFAQEVTEEYRGT